MNSTTFRSMTMVVLLAGTMATTPVFGQVTFFINSLADDSLQSSSGTLCETANDECTFRAALEAANNRSDTVTIDFSSGIPVDVMGRSIISPSTPLPTISSQVIIRGETHPNFSESDQLPRFLIDGTSATTYGLLLLFNGSQDSEVRFIAIYNGQHGIVLEETSGVTLLGNHIGLRPLLNNTSEIQGNGVFGIWVWASNDNIIENNWIGGNGSQGVIIDNSSADNVLIGNRIGLRPTAGGTGTAIAGNNNTGIHVSSNAGSGNRIGTCSIFPSPSCQSNIITANNGPGIRLLADGQQVQGNFIGISPNDPDNDAYGNAADGVLIESNNNDIFGGLIFSQRIGHNQQSGIVLTSNASNNTISDNWIGTDAVDGNQGNGGFGIDVSSGSNNVVQNSRIGYNNSGVRLNSANNSVIDNVVIANSLSGIDALSAPITIDGNVIGSHTLAGIIVNHSVVNQYATIRENHIGVRPNGSNIANARGILIFNGPTRIGDSEERGNVIGFNTFAGIETDRNSNTIIQSNFIGRTPDNDAVGNNGPGIFITSKLDNGSSLSLRIGYQQAAQIPFNPIPDGSGSGGLGNIIAHNTIGVLIDSENENVTLERHLIRGNSIFANTDGGIQLGSSIGDIDPGGNASGPNTLLNHPQLDDGATWLDASTNPHTLHFRYRVPTSTDNAAYPLRIDFYSTYSGQVQGRSWVGSDEYSASDAGQWRSGTLTPQAGVLTTAFGGSEIVAKAIDADRNTSEFSAESANVTTQGDPQPNELLVTAVTDEFNADSSSIFCNTGEPEVAPGIAHCTLRAAIQAANQFNEAAEIRFWSDIPNVQGVTTISPQLPLPAINHEITIAGDSHPHFNPGNARPRVVIRNNNVSFHPPQPGMLVNSTSGATIRYLAITEAEATGLEVRNSSNIRLEGNFIGLAIDGSQDVPLGNGTHGISLFNSTNTTITGNRIAANTGSGIVLQADVSNTVIIGNQIGVAADGTGGLAPAGNGQHGVSVTALAGSGNQIGFCSFNPIICTGNLIASSEEHNIFIAGDGNSLQANLIGINPDDPENADFGSGSDGIRINGKDNVISASIDSSIGFNTIGHSAGGHGINVSDGASGNSIFAARIGTNDLGQNLTNKGSGISVAGADSQVISGNIIGLNGESGIRITGGSKNMMTGNRIGVLNDGSPVGNTHTGIWINTGTPRPESLDNVIGFAALEDIPEGYDPEAEGPGNIIAHNGLQGVYVFGAEDTTLLGNSIRGNRIIANGGQSIDLGPDGDTIDPGGSDTGPNNLQNFPEFDTDFTHYDEDEDRLVYAFSVATTSSNASYPLQVDFYLTASPSDQARDFLATIEYPEIEATFPVGGIIEELSGLTLAGAYLIATATDSDGNTSQFSAPLLLGDPVDEIFHDRFEEAQE